MDSAPSEKPVSTSSARSISKPLAVAPATESTNIHLKTMNSSAEAEDREAGDAEAHHGAARERHLERRPRRRAGRVGRAHVGERGDAHAERSGGRRGDGADDEGDGDEPVRGLVENADSGEQGGDDDAEEGEHAVLADEERAGAVGDVAGDLGHAGRADVLPANPAGERKGVSERRDPDEGRDEEEEGCHRRMRTGNDPPSASPDSAGGPRRNRFGGLAAAVDASTLP